MVDQAFGHVDYEVAKILMSTFTGEADYGVQESVVSLLESSDRDVYYRALLGALPRLVAEAREWADALVAIELKKDPNALTKAIMNAPKEERDAVKVILADEDFRDLRPIAKDIWEML